MTEDKKYYVYKRSGHYYTIDTKPVYEKVLFEGTEKECYEFVKKELEMNNDEYRQGFEHLTKRHLVKLCKKMHKDCYRLVGQKMALKDQIAKANHIIKSFVSYEECAMPWCHKEMHEKTIEEARQFLKEVGYE